ncbi:MAG: sigma-70 family RNA polymerase sigma factor [Planctomycetaceae bacterium]
MKDDGDKCERFLLHLRPVQGALETFCRRSLFDVSLVEDVLQETVTRAFRDFGLFAEGTNFRAWIFRYAHLGILESNREFLTRRHQPLEAEPAVEDEWNLGGDESLLHTLLESPEILFEHCADDLIHAVLQLRPVDRAVLLLKAIGEFKYREIAEIVGVPLGTVMSSLSRARQQMRQALTKTRGGQGELPRQTGDGRHKDGP